MRPYFSENSEVIFIFEVSLNYHNINFSVKGVSSIFSPWLLQFVTLGHFIRRRDKMS